MINLSEATVTQRRRRVPQEQWGRVFLHRWMSGNAETPASWFPSLHPWNCRLFFPRSVWLSPSLDHRASYSDGTGGETQSGVYITHFLSSKLRWSAGLSVWMRWWKTAIMSYDWRGWACRRIEREWPIQEVKKQHIRFSALGEKRMRICCY